VNARLERKGTDEEQVALAPLDRFHGRGLDPGIADGAGFGSNADSHRGVLGRFPFRLDVFTGQGIEPAEVDALGFARPLHTALAKVVDGGGNVVLQRPCRGAGRFRHLNHRQRLMRR